MLLETLDIKKNDIIIYSQNIFNLDKNFKIIFKDDTEKLSRKINYGDVCRFVNEFTPKNLIVYRLLTNIKDFQIDLSKYGFFLNINDQAELIYFDPVFAVKELEEYSKVINLQNLRFRIQQVGLTTLNRKRNLPNFAEIYAVDLEAMEAKFQNDKVFADAIIVFSIHKKGISKKENKLETSAHSSSPGKKPEPKPNTSFAEKIKQPPSVITDEQKESIKEIKHEISEDKDFDYTQIMKMNFKDKTISEMADAKKETSGEKDAGVNLKDPVSPFSEFLRKKIADEKGKDKKASGEKIDFIDIFKSSTPLKEYISSKEDKKVVLRLNKK